MKRYEEMRKERMEEHKPSRGDREYAESEVHRATTIYHGVNGDYGQNKGFVDPPSYLKPRHGKGEHACYIPKKWLHTWVGHNKGV